jgi:hypothetical protein
MNQPRQIIHLAGNLGFPPATAFTTQNISEENYITNKKNKFILPTEPNQHRNNIFIPPIDV